MKFFIAIFLAFYNIFKFNKLKFGIVQYPNG
ncbi:MAG: hypothetical protein ACI8WT_002437 [Clostridium sp.]